MSIPRCSSEHPIAAFLLAAFLLGTVGSVQAQDVRVRNVEAYQQGKNVVIEYDLIGDRRVTYSVDLRLSRDGGDTFAYAPSSTSGAIGSSISPGEGKEIVWSVLQDFPDGIEGEDYQFKVVAEQEGQIPTEEPTAQRRESPEPSSTSSKGDGGGVDVGLGVGLAYNTRKTLQLQYYDGYQVTASIKPASSSISLRVNYRVTTGTFRQSNTLDFDLLYNGSFYYAGASFGMFGFDGNAFDFETNEYNLNLVSGIGFSLGSIYPYIEYRFPFSRGLRDDILGGGILYTF